MDEKEGPERLYIVRLRLTEDEISRFHDEGVLVLPGEFDRSEVAALADAFDRLKARAAELADTATVDGARFVMSATGANAAPRIQRVVWCGAAERGLAAIAEDPRIVFRAAQLLGTRAVDQLVHQAHFKEPNDGVEFTLHQDAWNRRYGTPLWRDDSPDGSYVQVVLTIDPMTEANGPLVYIPGSHRIGPILGPDRRERIDTLAQTTPPQAVVASQGTLVLFGPFLIHGSFRNESDSARRVLVNGYARPGVNHRSYHGAGTGVRRLIPTTNEHPTCAGVLPRGSPRLGT